MKSFREFADLGIPLTEVFCDNTQMLNEALIQLANQKDSHFGQVVIMAGGSGSGKGLIINNLIDIKGRLFDVDALKLMVRNQEEVRKRLRERLGKNVDIDSPNFLKNPEHTSAIHIVVKELGYEQRFKDAQWESIKVADKSRLPNLLFDITMKKPKDLDEVCDDVLKLGYKKENIHIVWVLSTMEVAYQNNLKRERVVDKEIFIDTHHGAAETMATIVKMGEKLRAKMDGNMVVAFNRTVIDGKNDVTVVKGKGGTNVFGKKAKPMYIDSAFYRYLKRKGQAPKSLKELEKEILLAIQERVPAEKLNAWFGE